MVKRTLLNLGTDINTLFADNNTGAISAGDGRTVTTNIVDSIGVGERASTTVANVGDPSTSLTALSDANQFLTAATTGLTVDIQADAEIGGRRFVIVNFGTNSFDVRDSGDNQLATVQSQRAFEFIYHGGSSSWLALPHGISENARTIQGVAVTTDAPANGQVLSFNTTTAQLEYGDFSASVAAGPGIAIDTTNPQSPAVRTIRDVVDVSAATQDVEIADYGTLFRQNNPAGSTVFNLPGITTAPDGYYIWVYSKGNISTLSAEVGETIDTGLALTQLRQVDLNMLTLVVKRDGSTTWDVIEVNRATPSFRRLADRTTSLPISSLVQLEQETGSVLHFTASANVTYSINAISVSPPFSQVVHNDNTNDATVTLASGLAGGFEGHTTLRVGDTVLITHNATSNGYTSLQIGEDLTVNGRLHILNYDHPALVGSFNALEGSLQVRIYVPDASRLNAASNWELGIQGIAYSSSNGNLTLPTIADGENVLTATISASDVSTWSALSNIGVSLSYQLDGVAQVANGPRFYLSSAQGTHPATGRIRIIRYNQPGIVGNFTNLVGNMQIIIEIESADRIGAITRVQMNGVTFTPGDPTNPLTVPTLADGENTLTIGIAAGDPVNWNANENFLVPIIDYTLDGNATTASGPLIALRSYAGL